jgi:hypothetical protein
MLELTFMAVGFAVLLAVIALGVGVHRGKIRSSTPLVVVGVAWSTAMVVCGILHNVAVITKASRVHKAYDFRYAALIESGNILLYFGLMNLAVLPAVRKGRTWAFAIAAATTLYLGSYFLLILPVFGIGLGIGVNGLYLCGILLEWNSVRGIPAGPVRPNSEIRRAGITVALSAIVVQIAMAFLWPFPRGPKSPNGGQFSFSADEARIAADFVPGPVYGLLLASCFSLVAWFQLRGAARRLGNVRLNAGAVAVIAATTTAAAGLFRLGVEAYLRAIASDTIVMQRVSPLNALLYGAMVASVFASARWARRVQPHSSEITMTHEHAPVEGTQQ